MEFNIGSTYEDSFPKAPPQRAYDYFDEEDKITAQDVQDLFSPIDIGNVSNNRLHNSINIAKNHTVLLSEQPQQQASSSQPSHPQEDLPEMDPALFERLTKQLADKQNELERKEMEIMQLQNVISKRRKKNCPFCCPFLYHNIRGIPTEHGRRLITYWAFVSWLIFCLVLICNCTTAWLTVYYPPGLSLQVTSMMTGQYLVISTIAIFVLPPAHFFLTYYPLYRAMDTTTIPRFLVFFLCYLVVTLFCLFGISGFMTYGVSGIIAAVYYYPSNMILGSIPAFVANIVMAVLWLVMALNFIAILIAGIVVYKRVHGSFTRMKEYGQSFVNDELTGNVRASVRSLATVN